MRRNKGITAIEVLTACAITCILGLLIIPPVFGALAAKWRNSDQAPIALAAVQVESDDTAPEREYDFYFYAPSNVTNFGRVLENVISNAGFQDASGLLGPLNGVQHYVIKRSQYNIDKTTGILTLTAPNGKKIMLSSATEWIIAQR